MYEHGKSDNRIVPRKLPNKAFKEVVEAMEERRLAEGNRLGQNTLRTQGRASVQSVLRRIRQAARCAWALLLEAGSQCVNSTRRDLCGACGATRIPTVAFYS